MTVAERAWTATTEQERLGLLVDVLGPDRAAEMTSSDFARIVDFGRVNRQAGRRATVLAWIAFAIVIAVGIRRTRSELARSLRLRFTLTGATPLEGSSRPGSARGG